MRSPQQRHTGWNGCQSFRDVNNHRAWYVPARMRARSSGVKSGESTRLLMYFDTYLAAPRRLRDARKLMRDDDGHAARHIAASWAQSRNGQRATTCACTCPSWSRPGVTSHVPQNGKAPQRS
jgi:hypothetical protein